MVPSFDALVSAVFAIYPEAKKEGATGGWSWTDDTGQVVAASCFVERQPHGRHWLALRAMRKAP